MRHPWLKTLSMTVLGLALLTPAAMAEGDGPPPPKPHKSNADSGQNSDREAKREKRKERREAEQEKRQERREEMAKRARHALFRGIELTDDQKAQLKTLREEAKADREKWKEEHKA